MAELNQPAVIKIIQDALGLKQGVSIDSSVNNLAEWDSLGHLSILTALDKALEGKAASVQELATADSVRKILTILKSNSLIED